MNGTKGDVVKGLIQECSLKCKVSVDIIKAKIYNQRRLEAGKPTHKVGLKPTGFNLFTSEVGFKSGLGLEWQQLSAEEKENFKEKAVDRGDQIGDPIERKICQIKSLITELGNLGVPTFCLMHKPGDTEVTAATGSSGGSFFESHPSIAQQFADYVGAEKGTTSLSALRHDVRALFNKKIFAATNGNIKFMPYESIHKDPSCLIVEGFPSGLSIKRPEMYGSAQLRKILESDLTFQWLGVSAVLNPELQMPRPLHHNGGNALKRFTRVLHPNMILLGVPRNFENVTDYAERDFWLFVITQKKREDAMFFKGVWLERQGHSRVYSSWSKTILVSSDKFARDQYGNVFNLQAKFHFSKIDSGKYELLERGEIVSKRVVSDFINQSRQ